MFVLSHTVALIFHLYFEILGVMVNHVTAEL